MRYSAVFECRALFYTSLGLFFLLVQQWQLDKYKTDGMNKSSVPFLSTLNPLCKCGIKKKKKKTPNHMAEVRPPKENLHYSSLHKLVRLFV